MKALRAPVKIAAEGEVVARGSARTARRAFIVEVNCQTDFVARGDEFKNVREERHRPSARASPRAPTSTALGNQKFPGGDQDGRREFAQELVAKTGENMRRPPLGARSRPTRPRAVSSTRTSTWAASSRSSSLSRPRTTPQDGRTPTSRHFVENVAMQIAAMSPLVVRQERRDPPKRQIAKQKEIYQAQMKLDLDERRCTPRRAREGGRTTNLSEADLAAEKKAAERRRRVRPRPCGPRSSRAR